MQQSHFVISKDGAPGRILEALNAEAGSGTRYLVQFENGPRIVIPAEILTVEQDGNYHMPYTLDELNRTPGMTERDGQMVIPLAAEELKVGKREVVTGKVRISKTVSEREETVDTPFMQERVNVERVPVGQMIDAPVEMRQEGNTLIIPVMEEVLVVEKRLMLKEEIRVTKEQFSGSKPLGVTLRSEDVRVERVDPGEGNP